MKPKQNIAQILAPTGRLRAAINIGSGVLAQSSPAAGLRGVTVELARELAHRLGIPLDLFSFESAGHVFRAMRDSAWDVAFLAIEPVRAAEIPFTPPYVTLGGTYMTRDTSPLHSLEDVDQPGVKIAVGRGSAYDLYLTRTLKHAEIIRAHTGGG